MPVSRHCKPIYLVHADAKLPPSQGLMLWSAEADLSMSKGRLVPRLRIKADLSMLVLHLSLTQVLEQACYEGFVKHEMKNVPLVLESTREHKGYQSIQQVVFHSLKKMKL